MQKVDILIGALGVVALVATGLGVALYDAGSDYDFRSVETGLQDMGDDDVDASGQTFSWPTPVNSTGAHFDIVVTVNGATPVQMGAVSVTAVLEGPDGSTRSETHNFDIAEGGSTFSIESLGWTEVPDSFTGAPQERSDHTTVWDEPIILEVYVDGPGAAGGLPLPGPTYDVSISGHAFTYEAFVEVPDPEAAQ